MRTNAAGAGARPATHPPTRPSTPTHAAPPPSTFASSSRAAVRWSRSAQSLTGGSSRSPRSCRRPTTCCARSADNCSRSLADRRAVRLACGAGRGWAGWTPGDAVAGPAAAALAAVCVAALVAQVGHGVVGLRRGHGLRCRSRPPWPSAGWSSSGAQGDGRQAPMSLLQAGNRDGDTAAASPSAPPQQPRRRRPHRLSRGHWIALVAGLLAALVNIAVLRDRRDTTLVAVATEPIETAAPVTPRMVRWVESVRPRQAQGLSLSACSLRR